MTFSDVIDRYGRNIKQEHLESAYNRVGRSFSGLLAQNFVVLKDVRDMNPVAASIRSGGGRAPVAGSGREEELVWVVGLAVGALIFPCRVLSAIFVKRWVTTRVIAQKTLGVQGGDLPQGEPPPKGASLPQTGQTGREPDLMGRLTRAMGWLQGGLQKTRRLSGAQNRNDSI